MPGANILTSFAMRSTGSPRAPNASCSAKTPESRNAGTVSNSSIGLFCLAVGHLVKQRHAVGLCPQPHLSGIGERGILDLKQLFAIEGHAEARAFEVDTQAVPGVNWNLNGCPITSLPPDNIERTADTVDGLVKNDIVLKRVGPRHIIIVRIFCPPNNAGGTVLGPGDGLELHFNEAVLDVGVILQN